ncbi:phage antirepressor KilAC domain-containing protein [Curtobacterium sp. 22159]|uniref:phage antirepressor KilAC domain-containing protein n=1 Tax=Curtobacterium sp. 22159 TaxID=3453882 RepID=UPI003F86D1FF
MSAKALDIFRFSGRDVRMILVDGEPWFVAADVIALLDLDRTALRRVDEDDKGVDSVHTPGGGQQLVTVNEAGLYSLVLGSRKPEAREFKRWVTHEVLPSIRRTGQYVAPAPEDDALLVARALVAAQGMLAAKDQQIAALTPRAEAWDDLASAEGTFLVADAAKMLAKAGIEIGATRLFQQLADMRWIYRAQGDGRWRCKQTVIELGYMEQVPMTRESHTTHERVPAPPQVRVTVKGLERLRVRLGRDLLAVAS